MYYFHTSMKKQHTCPLKCPFSSKKSRFLCSFKTPKTGCFLIKGKSVVQNQGFKTIFLKPYNYKSEQLLCKNVIFSLFLNTAVKKCLPALFLSHHFLKKRSFDLKKAVFFLFFLFLSHVEAEDSRSSFLPVPFQKGGDLVDPLKPHSSSSQSAEAFHIWKEIYLRLIMTSEEAFLKKHALYDAALLEELKRQVQDGVQVKRFFKETPRFYAAIGAVMALQAWQQSLQGGRMDPNWLDSYLQSIKSPTQLISFFAFLLASGTTHHLTLKYAHPKIKARMKDIYSRFASTATPLKEMKWRGPIYLGKTALLPEMPQGRYLLKDKAYWKFKARSFLLKERVFGVLGISNLSLTAGIMASSIVQQQLTAFENRKFNSNYQLCHNPQASSEEVDLACTLLHEETIQAFGPVPDEVVGVLLAGAINSTGWRIVSAAFRQGAKIRSWIKNDGKIPSSFKAKGKADLNTKALFDSSLTRKVMGKTWSALGKVSRPLQMLGHLISFMWIAGELHEPVSHTLLPLYLSFPVTAHLKGSPAQALTTQSADLPTLSPEEEALTCNEDTGEQCSYHKSIQNMHITSARMDKFRQNQMMMKVFAPALTWESFVSEITTSYEHYKRIYKDIYLAGVGLKSQNPIHQMYRLGKHYEESCTRSPLGTRQRQEEENLIQSHQIEAWTLNTQMSHMINDITTNTTSGGTTENSSFDKGVVSHQPYLFLDTKRANALSDREKLVVLKGVFSAGLKKASDLTESDLKPFYRDWNQAFRWASKKAREEGTDSALKILRDRAVASGLMLVRRTVKQKMSLREGLAPNLSPTKKPQSSAEFPLKNLKDFKEASNLLGESNIFIRLLKHTMFHKIKKATFFVKEDSLPAPGTQSKGFSPANTAQVATSVTTVCASVPHNLDHLQVENTGLLHPQPGWAFYKEETDTTVTRLQESRKQSQEPRLEWIKRLYKRKGWATSGLVDFVSVSALCGENLNKSFRHKEVLRKVSLIKGGKSSWEKEFAGDLDTEFKHFNMFQKINNPLPFGDSTKYVFLPPQIRDLKTHGLDIQNLCHNYSNTLSRMDSSVFTTTDFSSSSLFGVLDLWQGFKLTSMVYPSAEEELTQGSQSWPNLFVKLTNSLKKQNISPAQAEQNFENWWGENVEVYQDLFLRLADREYQHIINTSVVPAFFEDHTIPVKSHISVPLNQKPAALFTDSGRRTPHTVDGMYLNGRGQIESTTYKKPTATDVDFYPSSIFRPCSRQDSAFAIDQLFCSSKEAGLFKDLKISTRMLNTGNVMVPVASSGSEGWYSQMDFNVHLPVGVFKNIYYEINYWSDILTGFAECDPQVCKKIQNLLWDFKEALNPDEVLKTEEESNESQVQWLKTQIQQRHKRKQQLEELKQDVGLSHPSQMHHPMTLKKHIVAYAAERLAALSQQVLTYAVMGVDLAEQQQYRKEIEEEAMESAINQMKAEFLNQIMNQHATEEKAPVK